VEDNGDDLELTFDDHPSQPLHLARRLGMLTAPLHPLAATGSTDAVDPGSVAVVGAPLDKPQPVLDRQALARLSDLDPTGKNRLIERVLLAFRTSVARLRPQAEAARMSGDRAVLRLVVHTLKSSSASIGAMRLSQLCARIETAIRQETEHAADHDADLDALGAALDEVLHAIEPLLKERA